ncbi:MAG TPA: DUF4292 domain-containing protein [Flavobacteriales bacterium]|jgi:hypothetical protein|nr:DUF4292 domain-containing protein [Flavobacteriales bacterium]
MRCRAHIALVLPIALLIGCRSQRPVAQEPVRHRDLPARGPERLMDSLLKHTSAMPRYYSAKADVDVYLADGHKSVKAHVRSVADSAVWLSAVPALGIEVARALVTRDSLKFIDKLHDTYWVGDTVAAQKKFGIQPSLVLFQQALFGLPIGLDPKEKYRSDREDGQYVLVSKEKRKFIRAAEDLAVDDTLVGDKDLSERRMERTLRRAERKDAVVYKYWLDPDSFVVTRVLISDLAHDQQADVRYMQRTTVDGRSLPAVVTLSLSDPTHQVTGTLTLDHIALNGPLQLNFRVPEKFTPMP